MRKIGRTPSSTVPGSIAFNRGVVSRRYGVIPPEGILESRLPEFDDTVVRFQIAPAMSAQFSQALLEIGVGGGASAAAREGIEQFFLVLAGELELALSGPEDGRRLGANDYVFLPPGTQFSLRNRGTGIARVLRFQRRYIPAPGVDSPPVVISSIDRVERETNEASPGRYWQYLLPFQDMRFDIEMNVLSFEPGTYFPAVETHIMEHGLYMLDGHGMYFLDDRWYEVWKDDVIWMGPFVPQQFVPMGAGMSAYLLYKNVNRDVPL